MAAPSKDLPKIADDLKGELLKERSLKPCEAQEKNVLPSAEDLKQEKTHQNIMTGDYIDILDLKKYQSKGISEFKNASLKPTETVEKVVLPGSEEIKTEKNIQGVLDGVKGFESEKLKTVKTKEPTSPLVVAQVVNDFNQYFRKKIFKYFI